MRTNALASLALAALPLLGTGCGLFVIKGDAEITIDADLLATENVYDSIYQVDPNTVKDVQDNASSITEGKITDIDILVLDHLVGNAATTGSIELFARHAGDEFPADVDFLLQDVSLAEGMRYNVASGQQINRVSELIFPAEGGVKAIDLKIKATADAPPKMKLQLIFQLEFEGSAI